MLAETEAAMAAESKAESKRQAEARKLAVTKYGEKIVKAVDDIIKYIENKGDYEPVRKDILALIIIKATKNGNNTNKKKVSRVRSQARRHSK
jgi:hypothetical protein